MKEEFNTKEVHFKAVALSQEAFILIIHGKEDEALPLNEQAFELERQAALSLLDKEDIEPTRSILFRSAAVLAMDCHKYRDAEKMIALGLAGDPPEDVAEELRELFDDLRKLQRPKKVQKQPKKKVLQTA